MATTNDSAIVTPAEGQPHALAGAHRDVRRPYVSVTRFIDATSTVYRVGTSVLAGDVYGASPWVGRGSEACIRLGSGRMHVIVENPDAVSKGIAATLDGAPFDTNLIQLNAGDVGEHEVRVRAGASELTPKDAHGAPAAAQ